VSILPVHNLIKLSLTILVLAGTVFFMLDQTVEWDDNRNFRIEKWEDEDRYPVDQTFNIPYDDSVKTVMLDLEIGAGAFIIGEATDDLIDFNKRGTKAKYQYVVKRTDDRAVIKIERDEIKIVGGKANHSVEIKLNQEPVWDFELDAGAASVDFDLSEYKVNKFDLNGGAAAFELKFGSDYPETFVSIDAGASSIDIQIPDSSGCDLLITAVLSGKSIYGFEKIEHGHYRTENFDEAENNIFIEVDAAVSSFSITRY
jgi:hypothetical protein